MDSNSLSHTKWNCKYHIVFAPKFRRKIIYGKLRQDIANILSALCKRKGVKIVEAEMCLDHVHMLVEIPPSISVSSFVGYLKGKSTLMIFERHANLKYKFGNRHFWSEGYYVSTVGLNEATIKKYIQDQEKYDIMQDKLSSHRQIVKAHGLLSVKQTLENRLIYGSYPDIMNHETDAKELLYNLSNSYLYKDLLNLESVRRPALLAKLLTALALQVTSEVSYNELAQTIGTDNKTVEKYIDLLEKCYIIFKLNGFSRNLRTELKRAKKFYFYDNGIRNAILQNFAPLALRQDVGTLWENFFISERMKANQNAGRYVNSYFWRTSQQQEIDYLEECDGQFSLFEMKWNPKRANTKFPVSFLSAYQVKDQCIVTPENWIDWVME